MRCPFCSHPDTQVKDSRPSEDGQAIRRRRQCPSCGARFTTFERVQLRDLQVIKSDGKRVPFERDKIKRGLEKACWKRPVSDAQIEAVVSQVEHEVITQFDTEVDSTYVGELVISQLKALDQVAYVRFASVYREFTDVRDFFEELQPMLAESRLNAREPKPR